MQAKKNIRRRTFLYITAAIIAVTLVACSFVYIYFSRTLQERIEIDQKYMTEQTAQRLDTILADMKRTAYFLCCDKSVSSILTGGTVADLQFSQRDALIKTFYMYTGAPTTSLSYGTHTVLLVDPQFPISQRLGVHSFSISAVDNQYIFNAADAQHEEWYQKTAELNSLLYCFIDPENASSVFFSNLQKNIYITNPKYNQIVGVTLHKVPQARLQKILQGAKVTDRTVALFLYQDTVLSSNDPAMFPVGTTLSGEYQKLSSLRESQERVSMKLNQVSYGVTSVSLYDDWKVIVMVPGSDMWQHVGGLIPLVALFLAVTLLVGLFISGLFSRRLTRPILKLSETMSRVEGGQSLAPIKPERDTHDEITLLYDSYNRMSNRIHTLTLQADDEREQKRAAELRALQAQINPHFIYNTLDSVNCIALLSGQDDISTMVTALIDILKYSIQFSRTLVTLKEELAYLDRYIQIQHLRYMDRFTFINDIPEAYGDVQIPQITLQPLVENALLHAFRDNAKLEIRTFAHREGDLLMVHVMDNGSNVDAKQINDILRDGESSERYGIGIRNVDKRIHLNMGDAYGLHYESIATGGLDAVITIPYGLRE